MDLAMAVQEQLRLQGQIPRVRLGVTLRDIPSKLSAAGQIPAAGALIYELEKDGPLERAGLKPGDVLLQIDGRPVRQAVDVPLIVGRLQPGVAVSVQVWREGATHASSVTPDEVVDPPRAAGKPQ
jgi:serine protease Do